MKSLKPKKKKFTNKEFNKLEADIDYITNIARKCGFKKVEAEKAAFHLGDALEDLRKLVKGIDNRNLTSDELYEIMSHMPYHVELAHQSLNHDVSAGVYDFIEENLDTFKNLINQLEKESGGEWKEELKKVKEIINKHDPVGLLEIGAPKNEYEAEAKSILRRLTKGQTKEEIEKIVLEEFNFWFGEEIVKGSENNLKKIAENISKAFL